MGRQNAQRHNNGGQSRISDPRLCHHSVDKEQQPGQIGGRLRHVGELQPGDEIAAPRVDDSAGKRAQPVMADPPEVKVGPPPRQRKMHDRIRGEVRPHRHHQQKGCPGIKDP